jgi:arsenate reductase-like glutaredoxin family protein
MLPVEIKRYLQSHGFSSDLYKKDKEWLEKHNVDMEMVDKLKKFLTERL